ncbi:MAG: 50S ribosomal protein L19 [Candidatus Niyogibacteria bacterium]|nr:MAG: 50S ribosomal protein L19 [Candidatus Niyogibacteria bacterium]
MTLLREKIKFSPVDIGARAKIDFSTGDTIKVWQKVKEGDKSRLQAFEGLVIARKHGREPGATFTIRKVSAGVGVERIFPLYSPTIEKIEIVSRSKVRRAKLYYIRDKAAREIRKKMKKLIQVEKVMLAPSEAEEVIKKEKPKKENKEGV